MKSKINKKILQIMGVIIVIAILLGLILKDPLLYHALIELVSIIIAVNMLIIVLRGYWISQANYFTFLGISYGFVALFDLLHFLSYPAVGIISEANFNIPAQLWLVGRCIEAFVLIFSFYFFKQEKLKKKKIIIIYSLLSLGFITTIMRWEIFPKVYSTAQTATDFKIILELVIIATVIEALFCLIKKREKFHKYNVKFLLLAMVLTIISEVFFIWDMEVGNLAHTIGHLLKASSFYLIYLAIMRKFTEEANKLSQAVEQSPSTVVITDVNGGIEYVNPKFTAITGYEYQEVEGLNPRVLKSDYHSQEFYNDLWDAITAGNEWRNEFYNQKKNGEYYWEDASISPIKDNDGDISHFLKVGEDITNRKEYEKELEEKSRQLKEANDKIIEDLNKAKALHEQFLPSEFPQLEELECATYYQPAKKIGGDFYNVLKIDEQLIFYVVDVTGHALDGAMLNIFIRGTIDSFLLSKANSQTKFSPSEIMDFILQEFQKEDFPADYFICLVIGVLNLSTKNLKLSNAGIQVPPVIISKTGKVRKIERADLPISAVISMDKYQFEDQVLQLNPGDTLFLSTDGLIEEDKQGEKFGIDRLTNTISGKYYLDSQFMLNETINKFHDFSGKTQGKDDITLFTLHYKFKPLLEQSWSLENRLDDFYVVKKDFVDLLDQAEIENDLKQGIVIAFQELVINAIEHGNQFADDKKVTIDLFITNSYLRLTITDEGPGFDWESALQYGDLNLEEEQERGRGVIIANMISDYLTYNPQGNQVQFVKMRK